MPSTQTKYWNQWAHAYINVGGIDWKSNATKKPQRLHNTKVAYSLYECPKSMLVWGKAHSRLEFGKPCQRARTTKYGKRLCSWANVAKVKSIWGIKVETNECTISAKKGECP